MFVRGVMQQLEALRQGFNTVFPLDKLGASYLTRWVSGWHSSSFVPIVLFCRSGPCSSGSEPGINQCGDYEVLGLVNVLVEMTGQRWKPSCSSQFMTFLDCGSYRFFFLDILIYIIPTYPNFTSSVAAPALLSTISLTPSITSSLLDQLWQD